MRANALHLARPAQPHIEQRKDVGKDVFQIVQDVAAFGIKIGLLQIDLAGEPKRCKHSFDLLASLFRRTASAIGFRVRRATNTSGDVVPAPIAAWPRSDGQSALIRLSSAAAWP